MDIDFEAEFLNVNFDKLLTQMNSSLVNSDTHYLQYKQEYNRASRKRLEEFKKKTQEYNAFTTLGTRVSSPDNRHTFTFIDDTLRDQLLSEIKTIVLEQRRHFNAFSNYVNVMAKEPKMFSSETKKKKVSLFSKLRSK